MKPLKQTKKVETRKIQPATDKEKGASGLISFNNIEPYY